MRYLLMGLILFQSTGAIYGGGLLILDPSGKYLDMPLSLLQYSVFPDYLIPGLFLFLVLGIMPLVCFYGLIKRPPWKGLRFLNLYKNQHWSWNFSYYTGILLILWIDIEVMIIREADIIHLIYSILGLTIIIIAQLPSVKNFYFIGSENS